MDTETCPHCDGNGLAIYTDEDGRPVQDICVGCDGAGGVGACSSCALETPAPVLDENGGICYACHDELLSQEPS